MPRADTDRNLLFGILALQMDSITRDDLVTSMNAWVLEKHRPLGEILVERNALDAADRALLDPMVDRHVARHGGDANRSLAALSSIDSTAEILRQSVTDPDLLASIAHASRAAVTTDHVNVPGAGRFRKVRDHARGGLGVVFVARDEELHREVALKEIQDRHADDLDKRARFLMEAEITGGLEHPGIVPVYALGHYDDGRPFYAMRFIKGDSLKEAIGQFHANPTHKDDPGQRALALQKLLRRFLDVCNAVAYAHSRGVLHRDLKPDNVMVGKYGETLVVDWGLAKATGRSGEDRSDALPESTLVYTSPGGSAETLPGTVLGTPAYMSPEQAAGRLDLLGPRSDVYSLGATLYSLLTDRAPFTGKGLADILGKVERGEFPRPREASPWLDPALEAICLKAMALRPDDRYPSPPALAEDVERWLADEPVTAYPEPFARRARRWARRHRTALATAATAATVAALLLGGVAWFRIDQRNRTDASAQSTLRQAEALAIGASESGDLARWEKALAEAVRANERLESGGGSLTIHREAIARLEGFRAEQARCREALDAEKKDRQVVTDLEEGRLLQTNIKDDHYDYEAMIEAYLAGFRAYGIDVATLPIEDAAKRIRSSKVADALISALDDWAISPSTKNPGERPKAIARAAETDPVRATIRDDIARRDVAALRRRIERPEDRAKLGPQFRAVFDALLRLDPVASLPLLEIIRGEHPSDFWINHDLGMAYLNSKPPQAQEAVRCLSVAVALRPNSPGARFNLGLALKEQGKLDLAVESYRKAIQIQPDLATAQYNLGLVLKGQGKLDQAVDAYQKAIQIQPNYAEAHNNLSLVLRDQGKIDQAVESLRKAIQIKPGLANAHAGLGTVLQAQGKLDQAVESLRKAIQIQPDYAEGHIALGIALQSLGELDQAVDAYRKAIEIQPDHAGACCNLGVLLGTMGRFREALELLERGHSLGSRRPGWRYPSQAWVQQHRRFLELDTRLPAILKGEAKPTDAAERLELAVVCYRKGLHAASARFADEAFAEKPALANNPQTGSRYNAACSASLAGSGQCKNEPMPDEAGRIKLREQALGWLRADLAAWAKVLEGGNEPARKQAVGRTLAHWKEDADLAGIRDEGALAKLPEGEREGFRALWAEVDRLLAKARAGAP